MGNFRVEVSVCNNTTHANFKKMYADTLHLYYYFVLTVQHTQLKHPCPRWDFFLLYCIVLDFIRTCLFWLSCILSLLTTQTSMPSVGFKPATPASDRPQTATLDRSATGIRSSIFQLRRTLISYLNVLSYKWMRVKICKVWNIRLLQRTANHTPQKINEV
jgi:hypothetical protein